MDSPEQVRDRLLARFPGADVSVAPNPAPCGPSSLVVDAAHARDIAVFLRDDPALALDTCSNVTGVDWPDRLEVVYHLYSVARRQGPLVLRMRTADRAGQVSLPSLTPVWRSCEFQEREVFDLFGVAFSGHPDLRRILMWDEFRDHPMRRDYVEPDDYEWEPTAHEDILGKSRARQAAPAAAAPAPPDAGGARVEAAADPFSSGARIRAVHDEFHGNLLEVSMGPHHPSTHGVFRMMATLDGETVVRLKPVFGYLHRNHEKLGEQTTYLGSMPYTDRLDYFCAMTNNWAYALAVERLAGLAVPERAEFVRVILAELTRLLNHTCLAGFLLQDCGASGTPLMYAFREREKILDLFEALSGSRMMCNYQRFGGCRVDPDPGWLAAARRVVDGYGAFLDELEALLTGNEILMARTQGVGRLAADLAIGAGVTGPMLRASGVPHDLRKVDGYGVYPRLSFRVPLGDHGDAYDRYMVRVLEMRESIGLVRQALDALPGGPVMDPKAKLRGFRPKPGEAYGRIEGPKGEIGFYLISDGKPNPYRYRVRAPSFVNLTILEDMCLGHTIADAVIILGSIDIVLGEVDR